MVPSIFHVHIQTNEVESHDQWLQFDWISKTVVFKSVLQVS